jgi:hypothetical protein
MAADHRPGGKAEPIAVERRTHRLSIPHCPNCDAPPRIVTRTGYVVYVRCEQCAHVWSIEKPGWTRTHATPESQALRARAEQIRNISRLLGEQSRQMLKSSLRRIGVTAFGNDPTHRDDDSES